MKKERNSFRVVLLGDKFTGKTALIVRYLTDHYTTDNASGVNVAYSHDIMFNQETIAVHILDTSGEKQTSQAAVAWADCIIITYSIDSRKTFYKAKELLKEVQEINKIKTTLLVLIGTKSDLWSHRKVLRFEGELLARLYQSFHFEVSAFQDYAPIKKIFSIVTHQVFQNRKAEKMKANRTVFQKLLNTY